MARVVAELCAATARGGALLVLFLYLALPAAAQASRVPWTGWRSGALEERSPGPAGPVHWWPDQNVASKTSIPGEGYSSPIVTEDAVYVTTARVVPADQRLLAISRVMLLAWLAVLVVTTTSFLVGRCAEPGQGSLWSVAGLAGFLVLVVFVAALVLFGERVLRMVAHYVKTVGGQI
jgi:hypothetical protein